MARPIRIERAGGWYHVTARGNERKPIFRDNRDYIHFCEVMAEMVARFQVRLHCFVLMQNHYHLLIELKEPVLSRAIQWLNVSYTRGDDSLSIHSLAAAASAASFISHLRKCEARLDHAGCEWIVCWLCRQVDDFAKSPET